MREGSASPLNFLFTHHKSRAIIQAHVFLLAMFAGRERSSKAMSHVTQAPLTERA
jgi:hypothetical protein